MFAAQPRTVHPISGCLPNSVQGSDLAHVKPGYVEITCSDVRQCKTLPVAEYTKAMDMLSCAGARVAAGTMSKAALNDLETVLGFRCNPNGLVQHKQTQEIANPINVAAYDWVHSMLQGGTLVVEMEALMQTANIDRDRLRTFLADGSWAFPSISSTKFRQLHRVFDPRRTASDDSTKIKGSCAEFLGLVGMLRCFVSLELGHSDEFRPQVQSFEAVCAIVDTILDFKAGVLDVGTGSDRIQEAVQRHMQLHLVAYGPSFVKPKHHWMMDIAGQVRRDKLLVDCFVVERSHLRVKRVAEPITNTTDFEKSVLSSLLTVALQSRESECDGLVGSTAAWPGAPAIRIADKVRVWGVTHTIDDVVTLGDEVGLLVACCSDRGDLLMLVKPMTATTVISLHCKVYTVGADLAAWQAVHVRATLAWRYRANGSVMVVRR